MEGALGIVGIAKPAPITEVTGCAACMCGGGPAGLACHGVLGGGNGACVPPIGKGGCIKCIDCIGCIPQFIMGMFAGI